MPSRPPARSRARTFTTGPRASTSRRAHMHGDAAGACVCHATRDSLQRGRHCNDARWARVRRSGGCPRAQAGIDVSGSGLKREWATAGASLRGNGPQRERAYVGMGHSGSEPQWECHRSWCSLSSQAWKATSSLNVALLYTCTERIQRLLDGIGSAQITRALHVARCTLHAL